MAGSVNEREYDVEITITTNLYESEIENVIVDALESVGINVDHVSVNSDD